MATSLYGKGRDKFLNGSINWTADSGIKTMLINTDNYTVDIDVHEFLSSIPGNARVGEAIALSGKSTELGVANANDVTFPIVTGASVEALLIYKDTGVENTSPLLAYIDNATGLPFIPSGEDVTISWDNGANKIFKL